MPLEVELSPFQKEKLQSYFKFLEPDANGKLESHSLDRILKRIFEFTRWQKDSAKALQCKEIHTAFFEILFEKAVEEGGKRGMASLDDWYHIWAHILPGCKGMSNFPVWLRLMPKMLFDMIDRNGDGLITEEELIRFYREMVKVEDPALEGHTKEAYKDMTDGGRYPLNLDGYEQIFANFLIGKTPHGPGKYIFGCFKHDNTNWQLIAPLSTHDDAHSAKPKEENKIVQEKRPKKFGVLFT
ncbi:sarcoplasmic calcium-binding proteins I, III, and IV [Aplysia californica]|uniref:Sarcoplasmic calcium-binding proteins I, III, and IV n=1 Tax=Aplysia californica TaxID=6500 RepID=A0ABM0K301_APLCA|nr:sarcoplasmic calcium-binding proteins I, III, and IV [Aplysia californica]